MWISPYRAGVSVGFGNRQSQKVVVAMPVAGPMLLPQQPLTRQAFSPKALAEEVQKHVIGQEEAIEQLATAIYEHVIKNPRFFNQIKKNEVSLATADTVLSLHLVQKHVEQYYVPVKQDELYQKFLQGMTDHLQGQTSGNQAAKNFLAEVLLEATRKKIIRLQVDKLPKIRAAQSADSKALQEAKRAATAIIHNLDKATKVVSLSPPKKPSPLEMLMNTSVQDYLSLNEIKKNNVYMIGSSGHGKTEILRAFEHVLQKFGLAIPIVVFNANSLTQAGYEGLNVEDIARALLKKSSQDVDVASHGIVLLDEVDKKRAFPNSGLDVAGAGVQQNLLPVLEDGVSPMEIKPNSGHWIDFPWKNVLVIAAGAHEGLDKIVDERMKTQRGATAGFTAKTLRGEKPNLKAMIQAVQKGDLITFGMLKEFMRRFSTLIWLNNLGVSEMTRILTEPEQAILKQLQTLAQLDKIEIEFTPEALKAIAEKAHQQKNGASALQEILNKVTAKIRYERTPGRYEITQEMVKAVLK